MASYPEVRSDHHHANSLRTAPSLCADMIFGKDRAHFERLVDANKIIIQEMSLPLSATLMMNATTPNMNPYSAARQRTTRDITLS
jgi:hypothetical protein